MTYLFQLMRFGCLLILLEVSVLPSVFAASQTIALFGPQEFTRTRGDTNVFSSTITVPPFLGAPFSLNIVNGGAQKYRGAGIHKESEALELDEDASNTREVSSGSVWIDGVEVVSSSDFSKVVAGINRTLSLSPGNHQLEVRLHGEPGSFMTITIFGTMMAPVLPPPGSPGCLQVIPVPPSCLPTNPSLGIPPPPVPPY